MPKPDRKIARSHRQQPSPIPWRTGAVFVMLILALTYWAWKLRHTDEARLPWLEETPDLGPENSPGATFLERIQAGTNRPVSAAPGDSSRALLNPEDQIVRDFKEGARLLEAGQLDEAIQKYQNVLQLNPRSEDANFNLGIAYARQGKLREAEKHYREAIRLMPQYAEAHNNLGNVLASQNRLDEAIAHFEAALKILPDHATAHNNLGSVLARQGRIPEAAFHFAEAVKSLPEYVEAHFNLGIAYQTMGRIEEAKAALQTALRLKPGFRPAQRALDRIGPSAPSPPDAD